MFIDTFSLKAALDAATCPRCHTLGLTETASDAYDAAPPEHRHQAKYLLRPSLSARCPACLLVMGGGRVAASNKGSRQGQTEQGGHFSKTPPDSWQGNREGRQGGNCVGKLYRGRAQTIFPKLLQGFRPGEVTPYQPSPQTSRSTPSCRHEKNLRGWSASRVRNTSRVPQRAKMLPRESSREKAARDRERVQGFMVLEVEKHSAGISTAARIVTIVYIYYKNTTDTFSLS